MRLDENDKEKAMLMVGEEEFRFLIKKTWFFDLCYAHLDF